MTVGPPRLSPAMAVPVMSVPTPVTAMPMVAMPTPVTAVPVPVAVAVMAPAHFLGLDTIDVFLRDHGGLRALAARRHHGLSRRYRRQRRRLCARRERGRTGDKSNGEF